MKWRAFCISALMVAIGFAGQEPGSFAQDEPRVDAKIEILWPHGGASVAEADRANIRVYLFQQGTKNPFCEEATVDLNGPFLNNGVSSAIIPAFRQPVTVNGLSFYAWDYNDIDVSAARDPENRLYFTVLGVALGGRSIKLPGAFAQVNSNVWAHASNALTLFPTQQVPTGIGQTGLGEDVDVRIQIVWPHDQQGRAAPVVEADFANIRVTIFRKGTLISVPMEYDPGSVTLYGGLNQEPLRPVATGQKRLVTTTDGITYPVWDFDNVDVSAAEDSRNKYFFQIRGGRLSNIWVHGADGRTFFPQQDVPTSGCLLLER